MIRPTPREANLKVAVTAAEGPEVDAELSKGLEYWKQQLTPQPELLNLPTDRVRPTERTFEAARVAIDLSGELALSLRASRADYGLFVTLLAGCQILLWRLSGNPDPVTLIPRYLELEGQNDLFTYRGGSGLLPIRAAIDPAMRAEDYLATLETVVFEAYQHRNMSDDVTVLDLATPAQGGATEIE